MNVSAWAIRRPLPPLLLFIALSLAGVFGFSAMGVQDLPDVALPEVTVTLLQPGATPAQIETQSVRPVENQVAVLPGIKTLRATIVDGAAVIHAEFQLETRPQDALDGVRQAVARARAALPADGPEPVIARVDGVGRPMLAYTVASPERDALALSAWVDDTVATALQALPGVASVVRVGGASRELRVELDPLRLLALNASAADISRQLRQVQQDTAAGRARVGGADLALRAVAGAHSVDELARLDLPLADGRRIRLGQVGRVLDTEAEPTSLALLDGRPVVAFEVSRARGAGDLAVAAAVRAALDRLRAEQPDITITEAFNAVDTVQQSFDSAMLMLVEGALLAVLVVWLFLRDGRATLLAAVALPLSVLPTFGVMHLLGFTLNAVTLLSLSLAVGVLVDDAIVEIENIARHLRQGLSPRQAAMVAADEIGLAVIATTMALVAVFLPTAFMGGVVGRYFVQFGWTAALAVWFSLLVARLLTPMMAAWLLRPVLVRPERPERPVRPERLERPVPPVPPGSASLRPVPQAVAQARWPLSGDAEDRPPDHPPPAWLALVLRAVQACLRHRGLTLLAALALVLAAVPLAGQLPAGFMPADDQPQTQVSLSLPPGTTWAQTHALAEQARQQLQRLPHVRRIYTTIGGGQSGQDSPAALLQGQAARATLILTLSPRAQRPGITRQQLEAGLRQALADLPGARVQVGPGDGAERLTLDLSGSDGAALLAHARRVEQALRGLPGVGLVSSSAAAQRQDLVLLPDAARAADLGVTTAAMADTLRIATIGDADPDLARLNLAQRQWPVVVRLPAPAREDLALLARLPVPGARGPVMLGQVASLQLDSGPAQIDRRNRQRSITLEVGLNGQALGDVQAQALQLPALAQRPPGIGLAATGDAETMAELFKGFAVAMAVGLLCLYAVLALLFDDLLQPLVILVALLLALPGAVGALWLAGGELSMPALIGLVMLMGIAAKNAILLVDHVARSRRQHGLPARQAVLNACRQRARAIVMTTVAMVAGMLPVALGLGSDPSFRAPMAIVVIGGLLSSTVMSLLVVPVVVAGLADAAWALRRGPVVSPVKGA